ncbi:leucine-rich repeat and immunoglobulin-like domain-containing nogo receptor-interacting protein 1 isoform X1 [Corythoichthys intestinalis]|uniref:leucine-rich repeat and immunoglobulin-like domain-containing nogo receptor-interacting protein 1 isoform X1 n=1 Tax=Corythoichthys intestinalis TaxID=161448 RepID=UPI0025A51B7C|nr:leucine-rich repeat and immunoglobulin-like domain-containing nogo receptor-interacting protein 1 isoform X1 [Corythoichthys intestinalis]XP_057683703.1 leucine-rich repeat and immunoglobulin-like domain-containing nogo receptor-interacting protein 1 isoform X1 [Corythoichthys intestinalis]XP_057683704.1 leucine-rich repeat and immunoglobulin-like domain-containing nogo receptor-interacting protein 1 isoform X1 [Corythoichthys intestinalis]XP_057683705.1 leucine-rich repeat and immunoglobulin
MQTSCCSPPCWRALCVLAAGLTVTLQALPTCPHPCRCDPSGSAVDCSFARFATVPERLPLNLTRLNMSHNAIKTLAPEQFATLTRLEDLDLSDNVLAYVDADVFVGLRSLLDLRLARNRLKVLPVGIFAGLSRLRLLDVSDNELLGFLDFTFRELAGLRVLKALRNDVVFISRWAFAGLTDLRQLHLDTRNLTLVPTEAFAYLGGLTALHLHRLDSTVMPNYAFLGLGRLKELVISDWPRLETLSANSLVALNLTSLAIRSCNLSEIPYTALHHLVYLVRLDLSYNPIDYIQGNQLKELLRLEEFHMVGGQLRRIEMAAFRGLARLSLVNMSGNVLSTLEEGVFHSPNAIQRLRLDRNPLACDCRLVWLARRRLTLDFGESPPTCGSPGSWDFLKMAELLTCQSPRIRPRYPNIGRVDQGHAAVLHCNAEGRPAPSVTWLNPRRMALTDIGRVRALANGTLEVRYAQPQDAGTYRCVASNAAGNDTWPVELHVRALASNKPFHLKSWLISSPSSTAGPRDPPFDVKTLLIAASIGFLSFFSSVSVCFLAMFFWSKGKGQIKHTATIAYVPRTTATSSNGSTGNYMETSRFTMKLM